MTADRQSVVSSRVGIRRLIERGTDPAPARQIGAGDTRGDCGGKAALLLRYARSASGLLSMEEDARRAALSAPELESIESGGTRPGAAAVEEMGPSRKRCFYVCQVLILGCWRRR